MPFAATALLVLLAFQPTQTPNPNRISKTDDAQIAYQKERPGNAHGDSDKQPAPAGKAATVPEDQPELTPNDRDENKPNEDTLIQRRLEIFTGLLVVVGFLQVVVLIWQSCIFLRTLRMIHLQTSIYERQRMQMVKAGEQTERIIAQTRDSAEKQLRAYVCLTRAEMKIGPKFIRVHIHTKNSGQTPAYNVRQWIHQWITDYPLKETLPEPPDDLPMSNAALGPGDHLIMPAGWENLPSNLVVGTRERTVYIYGKVTYQDAFGRNRFTKYRLILGPNQVEGQPLVSTSGVVDVLLSPYTEGNEQD
jgi:hypothetical protein